MQDCDPSSDPGFFTVIGCHASGSYGARINERQQALDKEKEQGSMLADEIAASRIKQQQVHQTLTLKQQEIQGLEQHMEKIEAKLVNSKEKDAALQARINRSNAER